MAITALNNYAIGDVNFNTMMETLDKTFKGKADITISEYDTDSAPDVKVGSVFENNGSLFIVDSTDITPTGYSGISVSTPFYLYFDESATAFIYSSTTPTWSDVLQGYYNGTDRAFFSMYKDSGGTLYSSKSKLVNSMILQSKVIPIGAWDMNTDLLLDVPHGISDPDKIMSMFALIRSDTTSLSDYSIDVYDATHGVAGFITIYSTDRTKLRLGVVSGGFFNLNDFNSTAINRGYITIWYTD